MMKAWRICGLLVMYVMPGLLFAQVEPGMKADVFRQKMPGVVPAKVYYNEDLVINDRQAGLWGRWHLDFNHDSLRSVYFSHEAGPQPGRQLWTAFDSLVKKYTLQMGPPAWTHTGTDTSLSGRRVRRHNMDTLRAVCWKTRFADVVLGLYHTGNYKINMSRAEKEALKTLNAENPRQYFEIRTQIDRADHRGEVFSWDLYPGLHVYRVVEIRPGWFPKGLGVNGQWQSSETIQGLNGEWTYAFKGSVLGDMRWNYRSAVHHKQAFAQCYQAVQAIIQDYTARYGTPVLVTGDTKYRDPAKKLHYGYDVIKATWDMKTYFIEVYYRFEGEAGRYALAVDIVKTLK